MNLREVSRRLPLKKFEIYEDVSGKGHLAYSECHDPNDAGGKSKSFKTIYYSCHVDIERAFVEASSIYCNGLESRKPQVTKAEFKIKTRVVIREFCRGRDSGSPWSDPENDIVKSGSVNLDIKMDDPDETQHYDIGFAPHCPLYGISSAYTTLVKLWEHYLPSKREASEILAFEWRNRVFDKPYLMLDQLAVSGTLVDGDPRELGDHGDGPDDPRIKIDYFEDYVHFHKPNEIYGVAGKFYMNGAVIFTVADLMRKFPESSEYGIMSNGFYKAEEALAWIKQAYPQARRLNQGGMGHMMSL